MKRLLLFVVFYSVTIVAQSHNIVKDFNAGTIYRDSVRYTNLATLSPVNDSLHVIHLGPTFEYAKLTLLAGSTDSLKVYNGVIWYNRFGVATDTVFTNEVVMRDSSWSIVKRAVSNVATNTTYTIFPLSQLLVIELVNYRAASPTRSANYLLEAFRRAGF